MQQIPDRAKTKASTFQLSPCCGLNLVPDMPLPNINHCLSHAGIFLPLQMAIHLFSIPSLPKHSLVLVEELTNRVGRKIVIYLLNCRGWWPANRAGFQRVGGWVSGGNLISVCSSIRSSCGSGGAVWGVPCWVALISGLGGMIQDGDKTFLGII